MKCLVNPRFLDLWIEVHGRNFTLTLFNKRDAFLFYIKQISCLGSSIPSKNFYVSVSSEILRFVRTKTDLNHLVTAANTLLIRKIVNVFVSFQYSKRSLEDRFSVVFDLV